MRFRYKVSLNAFPDRWSLLIAEVIPEMYDARGTQVSQPFRHRKGLHPTFPMGRYISQPLAIKCNAIGQIGDFLRSCKYVSDQEQFAKPDYWQAPEEFEKRKAGDCEDFALWAWRQLLSLGYDARFVAGTGGRYGAGHAWVEYFRDDKCYLVEPLAARFGFTLLRLFTLKYSPEFSVSWDGKTLRYFSHKKPDTKISWWVLSPLVFEYLPFWAFLQIWKILLLPRSLWSFAKRNLLVRGVWFQRRQRNR